MREPISLSSLGFGCASVMGKVGKADGLRAMAQAYELGVTHFDVARSYGFGRAEGIVGRFIKGRRDKLTVATKFGVVPPELSLQKKVLIPVARQFAKFVPSLKSRLKSKSGQLLSQRNFDPSYAKSCLDKSLKELGTDYIDVYLLHEPMNAATDQFEAIRELMEASIKAGKIRRWGFALQSPEDFEWVEPLGGDIVQFDGNAATLGSLGKIVHSNLQRLITRPFMGGSVGNEMLRNQIQKLGLSDALANVAATPAEIALCLSHALCGPAGSVVCSMFSPDHIVANVRALSSWRGNPQMDSFLSKIFEATRLERCST